MSKSELEMHRTLDHPSSEPEAPPDHGDEE